MSLLKKLAGETALYGLSSILGRMLNFLLVFLYSHTLSKAENGTLNEMYAYVGFLMVIYTYRLESAFFRYGTAPEGRQKAYAAGLTSLLSTTTVITLLLLVFAAPIAGWLRYDAHPEYVRYFAIVLALDSIAELPFARLRMEQRPRRFVTGRLLNIGVNISLNLFWLLFCPWAAQHGLQWVHAVWSPGMGVGYAFLANMLASTATLLYLLPQMRGIAGQFDKALWRKMLAYAAPLIIVQFAGITNQMLDRVLLKWLLPGTPEENLAQVGVYGNNYKLAMLITIFTQAYRYAAEPFFFRHAADANAPLVQAQVTKWFTIVATAGMLAVLFGLDLVSWLLGPGYAAGAHVVPILLVANVFLGVYYNLSVWYRLKDKTLLGAWISIAGAALTVVLNILLVPRIGYVGAAWTALTTYAFMCFATWLPGLKYYPVKYEFGKMAFYMALALGLWQGSERLRPLLSGTPYAIWVLRVILYGAYLGLVYVWEWRRERLSPVKA